MAEKSKSSAVATCEHCVHFQNDPGILEQIFCGLTSMSSGYASVRAQDGLCLQHGLYLSAWESCPEFCPKHSPYSG